MLVMYLFWDYIPLKNLTIIYMIFQISFSFSMCMWKWTPKVLGDEFLRNLGLAEMLQQ